MYGIWEQSYSQLYLCALYCCCIPYLVVHQKALIFCFLLYDSTITAQHKHHTNNNHALTYIFPPQINCYRYLKDGIELEGYQSPLPYVITNYVDLYEKIGGGVIPTLEEICKAMRPEDKTVSELWISLQRMSCIAPYTAGILCHVEWCTRKQALIFIYHIL